MSAAMVPFIEDIEKLSSYPQPESLDLAIKGLLHLQTSTYAHIKTSHGPGIGNRPSGVPADELMCRLAKEKLKRDDDWDYRRMLDEMTTTSEVLAEYSIRGWFIEAVKMMKRWGTPLSKYG